MRHLFLRGIAFLLLASVALPTQAGIIYDADVTPGVIFGNGNQNGAFTISQENGLELGLRAKIDRSTTYNIIGDGQYHFDAGGQTSSPNRAIWNIDWSINSDYTGETNRNLADLTYSLAFSFAPDGLGSSLTNSYDPVNGVRGRDNGIGNNDSLTNYNPPTTFLGFTIPAYRGVSLADEYNVAQNSLNLGFAGYFPGFDPNAHGIYTITLTAFDNGSQIASNFIEVYVGDVAPEPVPEPTSVVLLGMGAVGIAYGAVRRRRQRINVDA